MMETRTVYFENTGEMNSDTALAAAYQRAKELGIKKVVVASTRGSTAVKAVDVFQGMKVVVVTHAYGGMVPNTSEFLDENRQIVESKGGKILTATHGFGGINGAFQSNMPRPAAGQPAAGGPPGGAMPVGGPGPGAGSKPQAVGAPGGGPAPAGGPGGGPSGGMPQRMPVPGEIMAQTLGVFCRGMKVAAEIIIMAADAGLVRTDEDVIAIAGSGRGADTAVVVQPANANRFFELKIKEIICKPRT